MVRLLTHICVTRPQWVNVVWKNRHAWSGECISEVKTRWPARLCMVWFSERVLWEFTLRFWANFTQCPIIATHLHARQLLTGCVSIPFWGIYWTLNDSHHKGSVVPNDYISLSIPRTNCPINSRFAGDAMMIMCFQCNGKCENCFIRDTYY